MMQYVSLYYFFEKGPIKALRVLFLVGLMGLFLFSVANEHLLTFLLVLLSLAVMAEIFFHFKLARLYPTHKISQNPTDMLTTATMPTLALYQMTHPKSFLSFATHQTDIKFMLSRMLIEPKELQAIAVDNKTLFAKALEYAQKTHTNYVDTPHVFAAYLLLTENQTKLLFQKQLKEVDVLGVIVWAQLAYPTRQEEAHMQIIGEGYGEALVSGWTYETKKYTLDWTTQALMERPEMFDRIDIFNQIVSVLSQPKHNNVLLIGESGSGKHLIIDKLAFESYNGHVPHILQHKRVLALVTGSLLAGMQNSSELEQRLQLVLAELSHAQVIMAIPQIEDILGSDSFHTDLSGSLLPYLENGAIPIIATTTPQAYKKYVEHSNLSDVFTPITFSQPDSETLYGMLFMAVLSLEKNQQVHFSYLSVVKAAELANRFDPLGVLPGSAVKLLEAAATAVLVQKKNTLSSDDIASEVELSTHVPVKEPDTKEKQLLMNLEAVLHKKIIGQDDAISAISEGMRRLRAGLTTSKKPISFLFLGPTGVGKTETAKALAETYYRGQANMIRLDMSEYSGADGLRRLLGSAPGEGDEKGELSEKVFDHPSSLILLDEFEKANPAIHDLFLQVLDDGRLTDNKGKTVSFTNCIIIATSNAGSEFIREHIQSSHSDPPTGGEESQKIPDQVRNDTVGDKAFHQQLLNYLQTNHTFKPELMNRFDEIIVFKPLDHTQVLTITTMLLQSLINKLNEQDITVTFDPAVIKKIANDSFDAELGARPIQRYIQETLEDIIAKKKLDGTLVRGSKATFTLDQAGNITLRLA